MSSPSTEACKVLYLLTHLIFTISKDPVESLRSFPLIPLPLAEPANPSLFSGQPFECFPSKDKVREGNLQMAAHTCNFTSREFITPECIFSDRLG